MNGKGGIANPAQHKVREKY